MSPFIKQCKGKDLSKVPESKLVELDWFWAIKYDGNYVQIHKNGEEVRFFTSGGKEFYLPRIAKQIREGIMWDHIILEGEYLYNCEGKLGDRVHSARLTTYRTKHSKGEAVIEDGKDLIMLFDFIDLKRPEVPYRVRRMQFRALLPNIDSANLQVVSSIGCSLQDAIELSKASRKDGWEGLFLIHSSHQYRPGKRVNEAIKLKYRPTADLYCIGLTEGKGKYKGLIGSLELIDENGIKVSVGTGLDDAARTLDPLVYLDKIIEIEYEQILDTYIQPVFKHVREDKEKWKS